MSELNFGLGSALGSESGAETAKLIFGDIDADFSGEQLKPLSAPLVFACPDSGQRLSSCGAAKLTCGVDEAGRGALMGPVCCAAVVLDPDRPIAGLADSKKLSLKAREALRQQILDQALDFSVVLIGPARIDQINILEATLEGMAIAVNSLTAAVTLARIDGNRAPKLSVPFDLEIKGDSRFAEIMAASILAKTTRDRYMLALAKKHPDRSIEKHKGYGTALHLSELEQLGTTDQHRGSFAPVRRALQAEVGFD